MTTRLYVFPSLRELSLTVTECGLHFVADVNPRAMIAGWAQSRLRPISRGHVKTLLLSRASCASQGEKTPVGGGIFGATQASATEMRFRFIKIIVSEGRAWPPETSCSCRAPGPCFLASAAE